MRDDSALAAHFLKTVSKLIRDKVANLVDRSGGQPPDCEFWGWIPIENGSHEYFAPPRHTIGWVDPPSQKVYINPDAIVLLLQRVRNLQFPGRHVLTRALKTRGIPTVSRILEGKSESVWVFTFEDILSPRLRKEISGPVDFRKNPIWASDKILGLPDDLRKFRFKR